MVKKLNDLKVYRASLELSHRSWEIYSNLDNSLKYHIGNQFLNACDSVGANIAEGFGRFHYNDKIRFYYNARGSLFEVKHWIYLLHQRELIREDEYRTILSLTENIGKMLNSFIQNSRENKSG